MTRGRFWGSAVVAALAVTGAAAWLFPYGALGLQSEIERHRAWLLILWTTGVMAICFGAAGLLSFVVPIGFREVAEAGSVRAAREARHELNREHPPGLYNFSGWLVSTGAALLVIYFIAAFSSSP